MEDYRRNKRIVYNDFPIKNQKGIKNRGDEFPLEAEGNPRLPEKKRNRDGHDHVSEHGKFSVRNRRVCYTAERDEKTAEFEVVLASMLLPKPSSSFRFPNLPRPE